MQTDPEMIERRISDTEAVFRLRVPKDLFYLDGHFPSFPLLPGVVQIKWAIQMAEIAFGISMEPERIEAIKFLEVLRAGDEFHMELRWNSTNTKLSYLLFYEERKFSSGRIVLANSPSVG